MWDWYSFEVHYVDSLHQITQNTLENQANGDVNSVSLNDAIMITTKACPTCGSLWQYVTSDDSLKLVKNHVVPMDSASGMVGGYSDQTAIFEATKAGDFTIKMAHGPVYKDIEDWDSSDASQVYEININVN
mmetsp:Transcript_51228/g.70353  ORF Transcript_51228/g.70353 Transcript_51228/m.70353 type:complete len:131 (+) Transcript_51228:390-782(+)|eukprot:CAMPEP_0176350844 /NCGR_PEP_ID=MMETSP0126-20121128/9780_1 /TAXON_ID=141414 ORGANISM="Strombidinopsis acuminatum, Strain SPMC142" /NCGR_SAMPLE_ID=MMETSP0126 /ASSEMBLY_ACC=CAM_ASM_000229 /LENGTH=130 /DNA_ID=CAMNT_0017701059 /DNA_START=444 /DNA_END=836 /DNA_ORIENTATION=-